MASEMRPANSVRVRRSRPLLSVPKKKKSRLMLAESVIASPSADFSSTAAFSNVLDRSR